MTPPVRILIIDDEENLRDLVKSYLRAEGYEVSEAADGETGVEAVRERHPDLVILDIGLPGIDGIETLRQIRTFSDVFVILLTARAEETDKVIGLSVGADDYLTKPFSPRELVARVKAMMRRGRATSLEESEILSFSGLEIDVPRRVVTTSDGERDLTALEFDLLKALAEQPGRVFSRRQLLESVWGWDYFGDERVVDVHIRNLRRALNDNTANPVFIGTVRGVGYRFLPSSE